MMIDEDDADKISEDAVDEMLDGAEVEEDEDELDPDLKDPIDEFGAGGDDSLKSREWE